jgi:hypothetical protein
MSTHTLFYSGLAAAVIGGLWTLRHWAMTWGMTRAELRRAWPGDEVSPHPIDTATRGITIRAPMETVWSWIVQIGQDRAGFYSYTWLENLFLAGMPRIERLVPEWQQRAVGDNVWMARPDRYDGNARQRVVETVPGETMTLAGPADWGHLVRREPNRDGTWSFILVPIDDKTTRLVMRSRGPAKPSLLRRLFWLGAFDPAHFIMERKMMLRLKTLAEAAAAS